MVDIMILPIELHLMIMKYMNGWTIYKLAQTNSYMNILCKDENFWKERTNKRYPDVEKEITWKRRYRLAATSRIIFVSIKYEYEDEEYTVWFNIFKSRKLAIIDIMDDIVETIKDIGVPNEIIKTIDLTKYSEETVKAIESGDELPDNKEISNFLQIVRKIYSKKLKQWNEVIGPFGNKYEVQQRIIQ